MARRVYSDAERAVAIAEAKALGASCGNDVTASIARKVGVSKRTLVRWVDGKVACVKTGNVANLTKDAEEAIDAMCERIARQAFSIVADASEDGEALTPLDAVRWSTVGAIAVDKMRIMREQSTARITIDDLRKAVEAEGFEWGDVIAEAEAIVDACDR